MFAVNDGLIVGDGKYLAIIIGNDAFVVENYLLKCFQNNIDRPVIDVSCFGGYREFVDGPISQTLTLEIIVNGRIEIVPADTIKINNIENMSIFELFKAINDKIEKRNDKT